MKKILNKVTFNLVSQNSFKLKYINEKLYRVTSSGLSSYKSTGLIRICGRVVLMLVIGVSYSKICQFTSPVRLPS
jgi:hypothetical protein